MNRVASLTSRVSRRTPQSAKWMIVTTLGLLFALSPSWENLIAGEPAGPLQTPKAGPNGPDTPKAQVATAPPASKTDRVVNHSLTNRNLPAGPAHPVESDPIARARHLIAECKVRFATVQDYTCTFFKRERIDGKLYTQHIMLMKARTKPASLYFKFVQPNGGREAIFVEGHNNNKILAHDVGLGRLVAGTMHLDPKGDMAMEENRHPVTEAGLGAMIDTIIDRWNHELHPGESLILFHPLAKVGDRPCMMVETIHPAKGPDFLFHKVKLYIDQEMGLPVRFEAYDWPKTVGAEPELMEEYLFVNLKLNVGLKDRDFDHKNGQYSYGRY